MTHLFCEASRPQEEAQQAADDDGEHGQDEEPVLLAHVLHAQPHRVQSHRHVHTPVGISPTHEAEPFPNRGSLEPGPRLGMATGEGRGMGGGGDGGRRRRRRRQWRENNRSLA